MADELSNRAFASLVGVSETSVRRAIKSGRLKLTPAGLIDREDGLRMWNDNAGPRSRVEDRPAAPQAPPGRAPGPGRGETGAVTQVQVQTAKTAVEIQLKQITLDRLRGTLIPKDAVQAYVFQWFRQERDAWLSWPARVAGRMTQTLAAEGISVDQRVVAIALERYVREHLAELGSIDPPQFGGIPGPN